MEVILLLVVYMSWNKQNYSLVSVLLSLYQANMRTIALKVPGKGPEEPVSASSAAAIKLWAFIYLHNCFLEYMKYLSSYNCESSLKYHCCPPRKTKHRESNSVVWLLPSNSSCPHWLFLQAPTFRMSHLHLQLICCCENRLTGGYPTLQPSQ